MYCILNEYDVYILCQSFELIFDIFKVTPHFNIYFSSASIYYYLLQDIPISIQECLMSISNLKSCLCTIFTPQYLQAVAQVLCLRWI